MNPSEYDIFVDKFYSDALQKEELRKLIMKMLSDREMYEWFRLNKIIFQ